LIVDYHVHTPYCGHAHGQIIQYIQTAIQKGMSEICFTDHLGRYYLSKVQKRRYWDWGMNERDLARYFNELSDLKEVFSSQIKIKIGLEIDYIEGAEEILQGIIEKYPLDFCIGSIHCLPRFSWKHISEIQEYDPELIYKDYFRLVKAALKSKIFHSIAHIDFIWRYVKWPELNKDCVFEEIVDTIKTAAECKTCVEINANGYIWSKANQHHPCDPFDFFLEQIKRFNASFTIGSDAHEPFLVGKAFPAIIALLKDKGLNTVCCFTDGKLFSEQLG
jgi:histidinol-phosphatase (PHP family)